MNRHLMAALAFILVGVALIAGVAWLTQKPSPSQSQNGSGFTWWPSQTSETQCAEGATCVCSEPLSGTPGSVAPTAPLVPVVSQGEWDRVTHEVRRLRARLVILERREALDREYRRHLLAQGLTARIEHVPVR